MTIDQNNAAAPEATTEVKVENQTVEAPVEAKVEVQNIEWSLDKFKGKSAKEVEESYKNLESLIGKKVTELPEDIVKKYLDVPSAPEEYKLADEAKDIISPDLLKKARDLNISQTQLKEITDLLAIETRQKKAEAEGKAEEYIKANQKELEVEFGKSLDKRLDAVKSILTQYGDENLNNELKQSGLLHNAKFIKFLDKVTQDALSVKLVGAEYAQRAITPAEAQNQLNAKKMDKEFMAAYINRSHPGHDHAVNEMTKLYSIAFNF